MNTIVQYDAVIEKCKTLFLNKTKDYGTAWRVLRTISVIDQIFIKAQRIRNLQETGVQLVQDDIADEFIGIINYSVIGLIQLTQQNDDYSDLSVEVVTKLYHENIEFAKSTMLNKNHDYGEAWRDMSEKSLVDLILMKILRVKKILENDGETLVSEGIDANYVDMINYAVFALILRNENQQ
jgi:hypothetical protein